MALAELQADLDYVKSEFEQVGSDLKTIKSGVDSALGLFKSGSSGLGSLGPALGLVTTMLKK